MRLIPIGRLYKTEKQANAAAKKLIERGCGKDWISVIKAGSVGEADSAETLSATIMGEHAPGHLPANHALVYAEGLQRGLSLVLVTAPFGSGRVAGHVLDSFDPVDIVLPQVVESQGLKSQATPLSDMFCLPTLSQGHSRFASLFGGLLSSNLTFPRWFGGLLSRNPTPLSSRFGLKTLSDKDGPRDASLGFPLLSDNPAPFSSRFNLKTLSPDSSPGETSFGLPLLSKNPTPLSSMFGMPVLSRRKD